MTRSGPSATSSRSSSVTSVAISTMRVPGRVEAGHLQVHPGQHGGTLPAASIAGAGSVAACSRFAVLRLDPDLPLPATPGRATPAPTWWPGPARCWRRAAAGRSSPTGIAVAIPEGYAGFVQPRSGLALRHGVTVLNSPGLIDSGYRDELRGDPGQPRPGTALRGPSRRPHRPAGDPAGRAGRRSSTPTRCRRRPGASAASATPGGETCLSCPRSRPWPASSPTQTAGRTVERAELAAFSALKTFDPPLDAVVGRTVRAVGRRGKYLALDLDGLWLVFHLARGGWVQWREQLAAGAAQAGQRAAGAAGRAQRRRRASTSPSRAPRSGWPSGWCGRSTTSRAIARLGPDPLAARLRRRRPRRRAGRPGRAT